MLNRLKSFRYASYLTPENIMGLGITFLLFVLIIYPLGSVIIQVFFPGYYHGQREFFGFSLLFELFERPLWRVSLQNSLLLATGTAFFATFLGMILAIVRTHLSFPTVRLLDLTAWLLLITPSFILAQGWLLFASSNGIAANLLGWEWVHSFVFQPFGLIFIMTLSKFSLAYLAISAAMEWNVAYYGHASRINGAGFLTEWRTIHVPLLMPAIVAGWALVFMDTIGDFGLPAALTTMYRFPTLPYSIYSAISTSPIRFDLAGVLAFYLVVILALAMLLVMLAMKKSRFDFLNNRAEQVQPRQIKRKWLAMSANLIFIGIVLIIPIGSSMLVSFFERLGAGFSWDNVTLAHYQAVFSLDSMLLTGLKHSLMIAGIASITSIVTGFFISYILTSTTFRLKGFINVLSILSLAVPGVVLGVGYIFVWNQPWLDELNLSLYGTPWILVIAAVAGAIPYAVRLQLGAFSKIPASMLQSAAMQGASMSNRMKDIVLPLIRFSLLSGAIVSFGTSVFDLAITSILYPPNFEMLPVVINRSFDQLDYGYSTAATVTSAAVVVGIMLIIDMTVKQCFKIVDQRKTR